MNRMNGTDAKMAALAADMPDDKAALLTVAQAAVGAVNAAIIAGDRDTAEAAWCRYEAVVWTLNGGGFFGFRGHRGAPGYVVEDYCRAPPGEIPMWGQSGSFVIGVDGVRALVDYRESFIRASFEFRAIDLDHPFISDTGYRSHFGDWCLGLAVDAVAAAIFKGYLSKERRALSPECAERLSHETLPDWMNALRPLPSRRPVPVGHALVDVFLPPHQAFIARRWAAQASKVYNVTCNGRRR